MVDAPFDAVGVSPIPGTAARRSGVDRTGWSGFMPPLEVAFGSELSPETALVSSAARKVASDRATESSFPIQWEPGPPARLHASFHDLLRVADELKLVSIQGRRLAEAIINAVPSRSLTKSLSTSKGELRFDGPPLLMGVVNVTPDSFSDGGLYLKPKAAVDRAWRLIEEGAHLIDLGGESTRPGVDPLDEEVELGRLLPVLRKLAPTCPVPISVDTYKARVAEAALGEGASLINDISGLTFEPSLAQVLARHGAPVILMHIRGRPKTMQQEPSYRWLVADVVESLAASLERAREAGIPLERCLIDPGLGFGKTFTHNEELIEAIPILRKLGLPVVVGPSRKAFIKAKWGDSPEALARGTAEVCRRARELGASVLRVHDVGAVREALEKDVQRP